MDRTEFIITNTFFRALQRLAKKYASLRNDVERFKVDFDNGLHGTQIGGGLQKYRIAIKSKEKGKRGGARVITYEMIAINTNKKVLLVDIYDKNEFDSKPKDELMRIVKNYFIENKTDK